MFDAVESLVLDLLEWVANGERSYDEVMDAWRTVMSPLSGLGGGEQSQADRQAVRKRAHNR